MLYNCEQEEAVSPLGPCCHHVSPLRGGGRAMIARVIIVAGTHSTPSFTPRKLAPWVSVALGAVAGWEHAERKNDRTLAAELCWRWRSQSRPVWGLSNTYLSAVRLRHQTNSYMIIAVVLGLGLFGNFITRAILCTSMVFVVKGLSVCQSPVLYQNGLTYHRNTFTIW